MRIIIIHLLIMKDLAGCDLWDRLCVWKLLPRRSEPPLAQGTSLATSSRRPGPTVARGGQFVACHIRSPGPSTGDSAYHRPSVIKPGSAHTSKFRIHYLNVRSACFAEFAAFLRFGKFRFKNCYVQSHKSLQRLYACFLFALFWLATPYFAELKVHLTSAKEKT